MEQLSLKGRMPTAADMVVQNKVNEIVEWINAPFQAEDLPGVFEINARLQKLESGPVGAYVEEEFAGLRKRLAKLESPSPLPEEDLETYLEQALAKIGAESIMVLKTKLEDTQGWVDHYQDKAQKAEAQITKLENSYEDRQKAVDFWYDQSVMQTKRANSLREMNEILHTRVGTPTWIKLALGGSVLINAAQAVFHFIL